VPTAPVSIALRGDKLDQLACFFAIDDGRPAPAIPTHYGGRLWG